MHVLHYSLGLAPYRTGGMTVWSTDLMKRQLADGNKVSLLYPSDIKLFNKKIAIKKEKQAGLINTFRLINPLPIPLLYGIDATDHYLHYDAKVDFTYFFSSHQFDVIHLHTFMGLPLEFLEQAKAAGIKIIYTAHDQFGIWPEPDINGTQKDVDPIFNDGYIGNQSVLSYKTIMVMQSSLYKALKHSALVKFASGRKKMSGWTVNDKTGDAEPMLANKDIYDELRQYYKRFFDLVDVVHYNSEFAREVFLAYGISRPSIVAHVYHSKMKPKPTVSIAHLGKSDRVRLLYNGTKTRSKGYYMLLSVLDKLQNEDALDFSLVVYGTDAADRPYIDARSAYSIENVDDVYTDVDITLVPSLLFDTFGKVVPESLSHGVPVIVSRMVGAQELVGNEKYGRVFMTEKGLLDYVRDIISDPAVLMKQKQAIEASTDLRFSADETYRAVTGLYRGESE